MPLPSISDFWALLLHERGGRGLPPARRGLEQHPLPLEEGFLRRLGWQGEAGHAVGRKAISNRLGFNLTSLGCPGVQGLTANGGKKRSHFLCFVGHFPVKGPH